MDVVDPNGAPVPGTFVGTGHSTASLSVEEILLSGTSRDFSNTGDPTGPARLMIFPSNNVSLSVLRPAESGFTGTTVSGLSVLEDRSETVQLVAPVSFAGRSLGCGSEQLSAKGEPLFRKKTQPGRPCHTKT